MAEARQADLANAKSGSESLGDELVVISREMRGYDCVYTYKKNTTLGTSAVWPEPGEPAVQMRLPVNFAVDEQSW